MKRKNCLAIIIIIAALLGFLSGCGLNQSYKYETDVKEESMFVIIEETYMWRVVYHKETKVMYAVSRDNNVFTLLVNSYGSPMVYERRDTE